MAGGLRLTPVPARHGVNVSDSYNFGEQLSEGKIRYLGYVVELGGVRAYHAGDTVIYEGQVELIGALKPHLALMPINSRGFYRETERNIVGNAGPARRRSWQRPSAPRCWCPCIGKCSPSIAASRVTLSPMSTRICPS